MKAVQWFYTTKAGRYVAVFLIGGTIAVASYAGVPGTEYLQQAMDFIKASGNAVATGALDVVTP